MQKLKEMIAGKLYGILLALLAAQPILDVLSYFADRFGLTAVTTLLRFGLLALVALLGFLLTDRKRVYLILYVLIALFWAAHMLNCFRIGYTSPVQDTANLLRLLNFPLYALTFITALKGRPHLRRAFYQGAFIAFLEIVLFTALPWISGHPRYTYDALGLGMLGWFLIPSAQSAVIVLSAPLAIFASYKSGKYPVYLLGVSLPAALMFVTGTKLNYFSIFIIGGAYIFLFILQLGKKSLRYVLPLFVLLAAAAVFKGQSPMAVRDSMTAYSQGNYSEMISEGLENSGADSETLKIITGSGRRPSSERQLEKVRRAALSIYSDTGVYSFRTQELNARFGMYNVMEAFGYTGSPEQLSNTRQLKLKYAGMVWQEKDFLTHLLGFEYSDFILGDSIYDLENDFPGVFYGVGYIGFTLYLLFFAVFFLEVFRALSGSVQRAVRDRRESDKPSRAPAWLGGFWQGVRGFLTIEVGAMGIGFLLSIIAAQISGNVLRRPNVTIYFAVSAACLYDLLYLQPGPEVPWKKSLKKTLTSRKQ